MKLLLDENLPHQLRKELPGHDCYTVAYMAWGGIENGELLSRAADAGFDALITNDRGLEYQHNPTALPLSVIVVLARANTMEAVRPLIPKVLEAIAGLQAKTFVKVE
jgi:predicted nuclease of predicted toxin-antitoxin system